MGWTSEYLGDSSHKGIRTACDNMFCDGYEVMKSVTVGRTYYAAVKTPAGYTMGVVIITHIDNGDYFNFTYKDMDEFMGPNESRCPESILKLLSPTDNEHALAWRERCKEYNRKKKLLDRLPLGAKVSVDGDVYKKSIYRRRKAWICWDKYVKLPETRIAEFGYEVV